MRDLLYKNLTSDDKRRKIIRSSEVSDDQGIRSVIHRHFIWMIKEIDPARTKEKPATSIYVVKEKINRECKQRFICRLKGSLYMVSGEKTYLVTYIHSLKIHLQDLTQLSPKQ